MNWYSSRYVENLPFLFLNHEYQPSTRTIECWKPFRAWKKSIVERGWLGYLIAFFFGKHKIYLNHPSWRPIRLINTKVKTLYSSILVTNSFTFYCFANGMRRGTSSWMFLDAFLFVINVSTTDFTLWVLSCSYNLLTI